MNDELTTTIGTRINLNLLGEINQELKRTGKRMAAWIKEAVEEKLQNDNKEILDAEIKFLESKLGLLQKRKISMKEKEEDINKIPESEIPFLIQSKQILERDPIFVKGRIAKYKNDYHKTYKISEQDFYELMENAAVQYELEKVVAE